MSFCTATRRDNVVARMPANSSMAELPQHAAAIDSSGPQHAAPSNGRTPALAHRMKHDKSILALAVSSQSIFAGTQGGEILVYSLDTYELRRTIEAHRGSVLALTLSHDQSLLFSSATDPIVNVSTTRCSGDPES